MKCARLNLQDRFKPKVKPEVQVSPAVENPRRYCQKRMVNPEHEEDPRWTDIYERYHCNAENNPAKTMKNVRDNSYSSDMFLSVQTLRFQGDVDQTKKVRASFKYKVPTDGAKHRMFVKQAVDNEYIDEGRSSQLSCYYFDDYVKYLFNNDKSRPNSGKSSLFLQGLSNKRENKETQVDPEETGEIDKISQKCNTKLKGFLKKTNRQELKQETRCSITDGDDDDTKIAFCKSGKRRSLTISRAQSPETVHVIRVDVVCNNNNTLARTDSKEKVIDSQIDIESLQTKRSYFADKYLLTNTMKKLDENLSGAKVTLLCKTFRLTERAKTHSANRVKLNIDEKCIEKDLKKCCNTRFRKQINFTNKVN